PMRFALLLPLAALGLLLSGCAGYKIGPVQPKFMAEIHKIAIPTFRNDTLEPRVEVPLATAVIKQFQHDGTYQIVNEKDSDAILEGWLDTIQRRPARSVRGNILLTKEYTLTIRCRFKLTNRVTGLVIDERTVSGTTSFYATGSDSVSQDVNQDERQAIPLAAEDMAVQLVSQYAEGW
ncbi:MAG: LptE family protein, partial [Chthoniobacter sp.]|uniref:LptE family protein n=1 Tax=Chthoniobacter sp. TaxID=2510640 RepID=UPI0032A6A80E